MKVYYKDINELYYDLKEKIANIELHNNRIIIFYNNDKYEIEQCIGGYKTYYNGKKESGITEDPDIYEFAVEFVHEKQIGLKELIIHDSQIINITENGIEYLDFYERKHFIDFNICNKNYNPDSKCIGERNITNFSFYFQYYNLKLIIRINSLYIFKKKNELLFGTKIKRFHH